MLAVIYRLDLARWCYTQPWPVHMLLYTALTRPHAYIQPLPFHVLLYTAFTLPHAVIYSLYPSTWCSLDRFDPSTWCYIQPWPFHMMLCNMYSLDPSTYDVWYVILARWCTDLYDTHFVLSGILSPHRSANHSSVPNYSRAGSLEVFKASLNVTQHIKWSMFHAIIQILNCLYSSKYY